jgi:hypothetical protein
MPGFDAFAVAVQSAARCCFKLLKFSSIFCPTFSASLWNSRKVNPSPLRGPIASRTHQLWPLAFQPVNGASAKQHNKKRHDNIKMMISSKCTKAGENKMPDESHLRPPEAWMPFCANAEGIRRAVE